MPIFEYVCDTCGERKDKLVSRAEADERKEFACECEEGATLHRSDVISPAALRFKGRWFGTTGSY